MAYGDGYYPDYRSPCRSAATTSMIMVVVEGVDKILGSKALGFLEPLKKDAYIVGPLVIYKKSDVLLVAKCLLEPSYVSVETALSYYV